MPTWKNTSDFSVAQYAAFPGDYPDSDTYLKTPSPSSWLESVYTLKTTHPLASSTYELVQRPDTRTLLKSTTGLHNRTPQPDSSLLQSHFKLSDPAHFRALRVRGGLAEGEGCRPRGHAGVWGPGECAMGVGEVLGGVKDAEEGT
ncbi:MAG: hypothetical protein MMC23_000145 [Stictis urceolatum]|nr:hypothetical protein [Stictis urceolata]